MDIFLKTKTIHKKLGKFILKIFGLYHYVEEFRERYNETDGFILDQTERIKVVEKLLKQLEEKHEHLDYLTSQALSSVLKCKAEVEKICKLLDVSVDVHVHGQSWAVISIRGKRDYINFVNLEESNIREIAMFLRQFERNNIHVDTPPFLLPKSEFFRQFDIKTNSW